MKKKVFLWAAIVIIVISVLNMKVTTKQGIDYKVSTLRIPLYLKVLDFFDRHFNYKWLVQRIIGNSGTDKEKVLKIFRWTCENIKKVPDGYPVIDDHLRKTIALAYFYRLQR
jgi:hypothetical protein